MKTTSSFIFVVLITLSLFSCQRPIPFAEPIQINEKLPVIGVSRKLIDNIHSIGFNSQFNLSLFDRDSVNQLLFFTSDSVITQRYFVDLYFNMLKLEQYNIDIEDIKHSIDQFVASQVISSRKTANQYALQKLVGYAQLSRKSGRNYVTDFPGLRLVTDTTLRINTSLPITDSDIDAILEISVPITKVGSTGLTAITKYDVLNVENDFRYTLQNKFNHNQLIVQSYYNDLELIDLLSEGKLDQVLSKNAFHLEPEHLKTISGHSQALICALRRSDTSFMTNINLDCAEESFIYKTRIDSFIPYHQEASTTTSPKRSMRIVSNKTIDSNLLANENKLYYLKDYRFYGSRMQIFDISYVSQDDLLSVLREEIAKIKSYCLCNDFYVIIYNSQFEYAINR